MVQKGTWSVVCHSIFGGLIGLALAREIAAYAAWGVWLWWVGALVGGLTVATLVDFRHLCACVSRAYQRELAEVRLAHAIWRAERKMPRRHRFLVLQALGAWSLGLTLVGLAAVMWSWLLLRTAIYMVESAATAQEALPMSLLVIMPLFVLCCICVLICGLVIMAGPILVTQFAGESRYRAVRIRAEMARRVLPLFALLAVAFPLALLVGAINVLANGCEELTRALVEAGNYLRTMAPVVWGAIKRGAWEAYVKAHSRRRRVVFIGATIGAAAGLITGYAVVTILVSGTLAFLEHEVIAVRWLKIVPE